MTENMEIVTDKSSGEASTHKDLIPGVLPVDSGGDMVVGDEVHAEWKDVAGPETVNAETAGEHTEKTAGKAEDTEELAGKADDTEEPAGKAEDTKEPAKAEDSSTAQDGGVPPPAAVVNAQAKLSVALHNESVLKRMESMLRKMCYVVFGINEFNMTRDDHCKFLNGFECFSSTVEHDYQHLLGVKLTFKSNKTKVNMDNLGHLKPFYQHCLDGNSRREVVIFMINHSNSMKVNPINMFMMNYVSMAQQVFPQITSSPHDYDMTDPASLYSGIYNIVLACGTSCKKIRMSWNQSHEKPCGISSFHEYFSSVTCTGLVGPYSCLKSEKAVQSVKRARNERDSKGETEEEESQREIRRDVAKKIRRSKEDVFKLVPDLSAQEKRMRELTFLKEKLHNIQSDDFLGWHMMPRELLVELLGAHAKTYGQALPCATQNENWMRANVSWLASQRLMELENGETHRDLRVEEDHFMSAMLLREHEEKMQGGRQRYVPTEFATQVVPATVLNLTCESLMEIDAAIMSLAGKLQVDKMKDLSKPENMDGDGIYALLGQILQKSEEEKEECQEHTPLQVKLACGLAWKFISASKSPNESVKHLRFFLLCCAVPWLGPLVRSEDVLETFCNLPKSDSHDSHGYFKQLCWEYHGRLRDGKVPKHLNQDWTPFASTLEVLRTAMAVSQRRRVRGGND
jgi:hypothetical protein